MDDKQAKQAKEDFKLHVSLVRKQDGAKASEAPFRAWLEGPEGLERRLGLGGVSRPGASDPSTQKKGA